MVEEQKTLAKAQIKQSIAAGHKLRFCDVVDSVLQAFMLRETNIKDICVELAKEGVIYNSWGPRLRKPQDESMIRA